MRARSYRGPYNGGEFVHFLVRDTFDERRTCVLREFLDPNYDYHSRGRSSLQPITITQGGREFRLRDSEKVKWTREWSIEPKWDTESLGHTEKLGQLLFQTLHAELSQVHPDQCLIKDGNTIKSLSKIEQWWMGQFRDREDGMESCHGKSAAMMACHVGAQPFVFVSSGNGSYRGPEAFADAAEAAGNRLDYWLMQAKRNLDHVAWYEYEKLANKEKLNDIILRAEQDRFMMRQGRRRYLRDRSKTPLSFGGIPFGTEKPPPPIRFVRGEAAQYGAFEVSYGDRAEWSKEEGERREALARVVWVSGSSAAGTFLTFADWEAVACASRNLRDYVRYGICGINLRNLEEFHLSQTLSFAPLLDEENLGAENHDDGKLGGGVNS